MIEFASEIIWSWAFLCWEILIMVLVSSLVIGLFMFSISSWFSLGKLCLSSNLSISSRLSNLLVCNGTIVLWYFAFLSYHVSFYLSPPFFWVYLRVCLSLKSSRFVDFFLLFFISFIPVLICIFSLSSNLRLSLFFLFQFFEK